MSLLCSFNLPSRTQKKQITGLLIEIYREHPTFGNMYPEGETLSRQFLAVEAQQPARVWPSPPSPLPHQHPQNKTFFPWVWPS